MRKSRHRGDGVCVGGRGGRGDRKEMIEDIKQKLGRRHLRAMGLGHVIKSGRSMKMD